MPVAGGSCGGRSCGARWRCLGGLLTEIGWMYGALSTLVDLWVMQGMVMDKT